MAAQSQNGIGAALILERVAMEVFRDQFGMLQCLQRGIGPRRKKLGPGPVLYAPPLGEEAHEMTMEEAMEIGRAEARFVLAGMCMACPFPQCKMKGWGDKITG